jgi:predicted MFS family arabinose efflux permease
MVGGYFSMFPTLCATLYGPKTGGKVYGILFSSVAVSILISAMLTKFLLNDMGYPPIISMTSGMACIALILVIFLNEDIMLNPNLKEKVKINS